MVQFNDTQDGPRTDRRTLELMEKVLDIEKPGFALINGDVING
ncbi:phosphoesterase, partial [Glutamicibacter nicotianae]